MSPLTESVISLLALSPMFLAGMVWRRGARTSPVALARPETSASSTLAVHSARIRPDGPIPPLFSAYHEGFSPPLDWSGAPGETRSFALVVDDPDAPGETPFVHWIAYNIPPGVTHLPEHLPGEGRLGMISGTLQGKNSARQIGYFGPMPPMKDGPHHYHFQLFALDTTLELPPGAEREDLLRAMAGHVLAKGELVGTYTEKKS